MGVAFPSELKRWVASVVFYATFVSGFFFCVLCCVLCSDSLQDVDLARDVLKSDTCSMRIPELDLEVLFVMIRSLEFAIAF